MGWFSSICSSVGRAVSSVASSVVSTVSSAWNTAKEVAGKAIGWMAEKAEGFVGGVKKVWNTVKPYVEQIRTGLRAAAQAVPWPWLKTAIMALDQGLGALTAFENSPIAKKVDSAIKWAINLAKRWQDHRQKQQQQKQNESPLEDDILSDEELELARQHRDTFRFVEREVVSEDERQHFELASAINDYQIAKTELNKALASVPTDFEHYLRLRATQKLLTLAEKKFLSATTVDDLSADDLFLVRIAANLIKSNPELSQDAAMRLDRLLQEKYGKKLTPFVFEEMIASWSMNAKGIADAWMTANQLYAKDVMLHKRLSLAKKIQGDLSAEEELELGKLDSSMPQAKAKLDALATEQGDLELYVGAAEGFLQLLEKEHEQIVNEGREYLIEEGADVGRLLIKCAEEGVAFSKLSEEEQSLITDYSNIFKSESRDRMQRVLEVAA